MPEKLKIAVQLFGHLRTYQKCALSLQKYLLKQYDCDVFMHTWSETEATTLTWHNENRKPKKVDDNVRNKIYKYYNPVKIKIENQQHIANDLSVACLHNDGKTPISAAGMNFMLYAQKQVNLLRQQYQQETNKHYDYVIMLRPDVCLEMPFRIDLWAREIETAIDFKARFCAINGCAESKSMAFGSDIASDILYFARPEDMDMIVSALDELVFSPDTKMWNPESLITAHLFKRGIASLNLHYYLNRNWFIIRPLRFQKKIMKNLIRIKFSSHFLHIVLLDFLPRNWVSVKFSVFNVFVFDFSIGKKKCII